MTCKIIQWNCHGYKENYNELLLLIAELNLTTYVSKKPSKKAMTNQIWKPLNNMTTYMILDKELWVEYQS